MFVQKLKLEPKFNLFLAIVFIVGALVSGLILSRVLEQAAQERVTNSAKLLVQTMNSVRDYTSTNVAPLLNPKLETDPAFIPETIPAFSATEVFQKLRKNEEYRNFFYKEATLDPTNLRDKADSFETKLVEQFRAETGTRELSGFRDLPGGKVFYIAHPLTITKASCLRCHSTPDRAPKSQIATYGSENGFNWKLGQVVAAQVVAVPAEQIYDSAQSSLQMIMGILLAVFAAILLAVNYLLRTTVIRPIRQMARTAQAVSLGQTSNEFEHRNQDEIGLLAAAFNRMKSSLEISINLLNRQQ